MVALGGVLCGEPPLRCALTEYCSENTYCKSCVDICDPDNHNYDEITCSSKCEGYVNDGQYVTKEDFYAAISSMHIYIAASLVLSIVVLLIVLGGLLTVWLKYQRIRCYKSKNFKKKMESIKTVCANEADNGKKLKLEMPAPTLDKDTPPSALTTMTPLSTRTRYPTEDNTLEYAYDNPTLTHSPVLDKNQPQNTPNTTPRTTRTETSF